ncbi:hypothetical protein, partial [Microscilla marina]|uniref:hypothetical protein n=1 Tax=Microscilla marina TaxID=1027 RepID=UPI001E3288C2
NMLESASRYDITDFVSDETRLLSVAGDGMDWVMKNGSHFAPNAWGLPVKLLLYYLRVSTKDYRSKTLYNK